MRVRIGWVVASVLAALLVASNLFWLYRALDQASIEKYHDQMLYERLEALSAALAVIPTLASDLEKPIVVEKVAAVLNEQEPYEKEGVTVIDWLTFEFDSTDHLSRVSTIFLVYEQE